MTIRCPTCGVAHDLEHIEPAFSRPDAFVAIPLSARESRARHSDEGCILVSEDGATLTFYIRTILRVPIRGESKPIGWGVWVEVNHSTYTTIGEHLEDPAQDSLGPFPATLANRIPNYSETLGLPGSIQPTGPATRPVFRLTPATANLFVREATEGVLPERAMEWRLWSIHPPAASAG